MNLNQVTLDATDIARSTDFYQRLGLEMIVSADQYARFACPGGATLSVHLVPEVAPSRNGVYFECDDLDERVRALQAAGVDFESPPTDQRWLWREAWLRDPDGHRLCLYFAGENRLNPPWRLAIQALP